MRNSFSWGTHQKFATATKKKKGSLGKKNVPLSPWGPSKTKEKEKKALITTGLDIKKHIQIWES